jgi:hypothetical protein
MNIEEAKCYEAILAKVPDFARIGEALSKTLYELCRESNTETAYALGEQVRILAIQWASLAAKTGFQAAHDEKIFDQ